jgi:Leucine-rich repeat (LRR) protein
VSSQKRESFFIDNLFALLIFFCLGSLQKLKVLSLRNNELKALPSTISLLLCLEELYLDNNRLTEPPLSLGSLVKLHKFEATNNPFLNRLPRDMKVDIITYLRNLQRSGTAKKKYRMKLMFVGNGSVGKTSLLKALMSKKKPQKGTFTKKLLQSSYVIFIVSTRHSRLFFSFLKIITT